MGSMCLCVVMRKIPVVTMPKLRPFTTNGFPQTTPSRSVDLQRFVQVLDDDIFEHIQTSTQHFPSFVNCQVIYSQFGLAIHQNDHQARRRFVGWAQNEIAVVPDFHKRILFSDEAHFWLNGYVNKQNCRIWSEANP
ncbi:hypothetical protein TNCV_1401931 [Trichonephila clavipes]|nr:hypothetical protein TNCV_1401931 [Trichonephila clavipes]